MSFYVNEVWFIWLRLVKKEIIPFVKLNANHVPDYNLSYPPIIWLSEFDISILSLSVGLFENSSLLNNSTNRNVPVLFI